MYKIEFFIKIAFNINYDLFFNKQSGYVNRIMKSIVDPNLVIFLGSEGIHWITEDCGNTIRSLGKG